MATLLLFGRPASGKGTVGQRLEAAGYRTCSTGEAMRAWAAGPSLEQQELRATMAAGGYGSDAQAVHIVRAFIMGLADGAAADVILDGFPRNLDQLNAWLAAPLDHGIGVLVDTPEAECRRRVLARLVCAACGRTDRVPATVCADCGAALERRADDRDRAAFDRRIADFDARVAPIIEAWADEGLPLIRLDGTQSENAIVTDLEAQLAGLIAGYKP